MLRRIELLTKPAPLVAAVIAVAVAAHAYASSGGAPNGFNGSPASFGQTCAACHSVSSKGTGSVTLLEAPLGYRPNAIYDLIVRVADDDQAGAGFEVSVEDPNGNHLGTLLASNALNTQVIFDDWLTHTGDGVDNSITGWAAMGQAAEYVLQWQAPSADEGPVTFWVAGNAVNDAQGSNGDHVYVTTQTAEYCPADTNGDGLVDVNDLNNVILDWGTDGAANGGDITDVTGTGPPDGIVDVNDLAAVFVGWGLCQ